MIRALMLVCVGALAFAGVYLWGRPERDAAGPLVTASIARTGDAAPVRDVTPSDMTAPPPAQMSAADETGQTEAPPAPAAPASTETPAATASDGEPRLQRLFNPIFTGAGIIRLSDREIRLAGIDAPAFDATCGEGNGAWPCGRMARSALQRFVRGRAIECEVPGGADAVPDAARCSIAGDDIAAWLVTQGWAKRTGETYAAEERRARDAALGLWGTDRPDRQALAATDG